MPDSIIYSKKAKAHDLTLINLKSQNLDNLSPEDLATKYLEVYSIIFEILEKDRKSNLKPKARFE